MAWLVFSYSLPSKSGSGPRVTLWRRLRRLGACAVAGGAQVLPARAECAEALQWLAQEVRQAGGEALVLHVEQFEGLTDRQLVDLFCAARAEEYAALETQAAKLESGRRKADARRIRETLSRLWRQLAEIARVDYFGCAEGKSAAARLEALERLVAPAAATPHAPPQNIADYRGKCWVTRPHPHVDRLACAWLIRHFINPNAAIRYALSPAPDEIPFDMERGPFTHAGNRCTFEIMLLAFGLDEPGLQVIAEIVHDIDLQDGRYLRAETAGIESVLGGWRLAGLADADLEARGCSLFEGLYLAASTP